MSATMQDQIREIMAGVEKQPRGNLEAVPEVDTDEMLKRLGAEPETEPPEGNDDAVQAEQETEATDAEPETEAVEETEGEAEAIKLADLAGMLEWEAEAVYNIQMPLGEGETITLGEAKDRIKEAAELLNNRDATQTELDERKADIETREAQLAQQLQMAAPAELIQAEAALQRISEEVNGMDWQTLETTNPGQAALMRQKLGDQIRMATERRDGIKANIEQLRGDLQQQQAASAQQHLEQAKHDLHRLIPAWANEATFTAEREQLVGYGIEQGIDESIMRMIGDPKIIHYLYRNWQRDKAIDKAKPIEKPPKVIKPQAAKNRAAHRKSKTEKLVAKAKTSKDTRDHVAAARALLTGA